MACSPTSLGRSSPLAAGHASRLPWLRAWRVAALAFAFGLVGAQLAEIPWRHALRGYDNTFNFLWLRSLAVDGDWMFANDISQCPTLSEDYQRSALSLVSDVPDRVPNKYGVGWAVLTTPGYVLAELLVAAGNGLGLWDLERDGWNAVYQVCIVLWHAALGLVALGLAHAVVRRWVDEPWVSTGVITVWLGSSLPYYQMSNVGMSHGAVFFSVAAAAFALVRGLEAPHARWTWLAAGAALGLAVVSRHQSAVYCLFALAAVAARGRALGWRAAGAAVWLAAGAAPFLGLQMVAWRVVYGRWFVFTYGVEGEGFSWLRPAWPEALFSPFHGLFYWHPLLFLATAGLTWWAWERRGAAVVGVATTVATLYINAAWWCWWFAASFGSRSFDAALLPLMAGQAFLFERLPEAARRILWVACGLLGAWNAYVLLLYRTATISRNEPVTWVEMLAAATRLAEHLRLE